jgi:hypothetical protein
MGAGLIRRFVVVKRPSIVDRGSVWAGDRTAASRRAVDPNGPIPYHCLRKREFDRVIAGEHPAPTGLTP